MMRYLGSLLVLVPVGIPLLRTPSELVGSLGAAAGVLCGVGIVIWSVPFVAAGASLALAEYALALWMTAAPPDLAGAIGLGVTLWLLLEVTGFAGRVRGVAVAPEVFRGQACNWITTATALTAIGGVSAMITGVVALEGPAWLHPVVEAVGALGVFLGILRALLLASPDPREGDRKAASRVSPMESSWS